MKKIQVYLDVVSPFSHHALTYLLSHRPVLQEHNVSLEVVPVYLGGIMQGSSNTPPWRVDSKAVYLTYETERAQRYFRSIGGKFYGDHGVGDVTRIWQTPSFFPILSVLPMRILTHLRQSYPTHIYESTFLTFFHYTWSADPQLDLSKVENVVHALEHTYPNASTEGIPSPSQTEEGNLPKPAFTTEEIQSLLKSAATAPVKDRLKETTDYCVKELGAFGCPYFWVINDERSSGSSPYSGTTSSSSSQPGAARWRKIERNDGGEPFFGSDRWHYMWEYLDIPWSDVRVLRAGDVGAELSEADKRSNEVLSKL